MLSKARLKNVQIYSLFKCLKVSFLGQFLVGGQGQGGMAPMASLGPPLDIQSLNPLIFQV